MKTKTILIIVVTVLLTIVITQNTDAVSFKLLFWNLDVSKLILIPSLLTIGFLLGLLSRKSRRTTVPEEYEKPQLNDEDRDYIS